MSALIKMPEMAGELLDYLAQQAAGGHKWVVYDADHPISGIWDLHCFRSQLAALDFERAYQQLF